MHSMQPSPTYFDHLLTCICKLINFINFISIQEALIIGTIPIPALYQIKNKLTQSLTRLTHSTALVLPYYSVHISNSWCKITSFKIIPSSAECVIYTRYRHSSCKNYTPRCKKFWDTMMTFCNKTNRSHTQLIQNNWRATISLQLLLPAVRWPSYVSRRNSFVTWLHFRARSHIICAWFVFNENYTRYTQMYLALSWTCR